MGFFSWLTADTEESISNVYSERPVRPVFLLQPGGRTAIREDAYEGYGVFGGMDAYEWLARENMPAEKLAGLSEDDIRCIGISLDVGSYYVDAQTGDKLAIFHKEPSLINPSIIFHAVSFDSALPGYGGQTANELIASGRLLREQFEVGVPLKFSFDPEARWEDLPASKNCKDQGYFYADDDTEDEDEYECA